MSGADLFNYAYEDINTATYVEERRKDEDGKWYTWNEYVDYYGNEALFVWEKSEQVPYGMQLKFGRNDQCGSYTAPNGRYYGLFRSEYNSFLDPIEMKIDTNGIYYTKDEFIEYYGEFQGKINWMLCDYTITSDEEPS
jgi:hypothetical protein